MPTATSTTRPAANDWLNHPSYVPAREHLVARLSSPSHVFQRVGGIVFLCGAADNTRRAKITSYIEKWQPSLRVFRADDVWTEISQSSRRNALDMERYVAGLADAVIVVVESAGSIAELGAFSLSDDLRKKLLPILDRRYEHDSSFINTGPIRWVDEDSIYAPSIWADFDIILAAMGEVLERLRRLSAKRMVFHEKRALSDKYLLFFLADLLTIIGPAPIKQIKYFVDNAIARRDEEDLASLLGLAVALRLIDRKEVNGVRYYFRANAEDPFEPFVVRAKFNLAGERARMLGTLLGIPAARAVISAP